MAQTIRRDRPFIICEILPREHHNEKTRRVIESLGYTAYWITSTGYVRVSRFDFERPVFEDFLLTPASPAGEVVGNLEAFWASRATSLRSQATAPGL
jgi:hypothetical protein